MKKSLSILLALILLITTFIGCSGSEDELTYDQAVEKLRAFQSSGKATATTVEHQPDPTWISNNVQIDELPSIDRYPISVQGNGAINIEIFSSTEKASAKSARWFDLMAQQFNNEHRSVTIRPIASGAALDYLVTRKHIPDAYTPANELWIEIIKSSGVQVEELESRLVGNVAGILMNKTMNDTFKAQYGEINMGNVTQAVMDDNLILGHTNPNFSSTGLNIYLQELISFDSNNPFSDAAVAKFKDYQNKVPPVSNTTDDMADVAVQGILDAIIMEAQEYSTRPTLADWIFTPVGVRHDSPVYALEGLSGDKLEVLKEFIAFCKTPAAQAEATKAGFNQHDSYQGVRNQFTGAELRTALQIWKENKDGGKPVVSVFIVDRSGSMAGEKLNRTKIAINNSLKYINESNYIGLVSYSSPGNITIDLPIDKFTPRQQALFVGAVNSFEAEGATATNSALVVALNMLLDTKDTIPDARFRIILFTDGEQNQGLNLNQVIGTISGLNVPIYGVGFEADVRDLEALAKVNESYCINADSEDVVQKLRDLFITQL